METISVVNRVAIGDMVRRSAGRVPNKVAIKEGGKTLTFKQLDEATNQFANYLLAQGYQKGDKIATICANSWQFVVTIFGIQKAGLVWVPVNPLISPEQINFIIENSEAKLIVIDKDFEKMTGLFAHDGPGVLFIRDKEASEDSLEAVLQGSNTNEPEVDIYDRDTAQIMYTSGTTGMPKGVVIQHVSVYIATLANLIEMQANPKDIQGVILPFFHCAQHTILASFIHIGATSIIERQFEPVSFLNKIKEEQITYMTGLPMMYRALLNLPNRKKEDTASLRLCVYAMAPMDERTIKMCVDELCPEFALATGQTEIYPATAMFKPEDQLRKSGPYWGTSSLMNDTKIMDDDGNFLKANTIGEIVHRGPNVMVEYYKNPEETEKARQYDWHHTGDLGYIDEDGLLVFVDRKKDIIKTGGENVASIVVERAFLAHEAVFNAAAVGLPHDHWTEAITVFVTLNEDASITKEELLEFSKQKLSNFEVPKDIIIVNELPTTVTGKIQKHILRDQYAAHYSDLENPV